MAYDAPRVAQMTLERLRANPRVSLASLSCEFGVTRHTISRHLKTHVGKSFRELQAAAIIAALQTRISGSPSDSVKEIAHCLGYGSPQALAKRSVALTGMSVSRLRLALAHPTRAITSP